MKPWYKAEQNAQTEYDALRHQVIMAIKVARSGRIDHALTNLEHAVGYRQTNRDWQDQG